MLSEISQAENVRYLYDFTYMWNLKNKTNKHNKQTHVKQTQMKVTQLCLTLCNLIDYTVHGILQARIVEWGRHAILQEIFSTQGLNPCLPHCRQFLYQLSHQGSPKYWGGQPIPSPGDLPNPGIEPESPALQEILLSPWICIFSHSLNVCPLKSYNDLQR